MSITTTTHLNFRGEARDALEFYRSVFGGETTIATYGDFGLPTDAPGADHVVWGQVLGADGFRVMAYDIPGEGETRVGETVRDNGVTVTTEKFFVSVRGGVRRRGAGALAGPRRWRHHRRALRSRPVGTRVRHAHRPLRCHLDP